MAVLKSLVTLIVEGKVVESEKSFECADSLAESLVQRGFASPLKEAEEIEAPQLPEVDPREVEIRKDYNKKNTDELLEIAEAIGIDIPEKSKKAQIIDLLVAAELEEGAE